MKDTQHLSVFVLIDALGWTYIQDNEFLTDLLPYRRPLQTVLGFSSGAIPTILTGLPPAQNGHWNLFYYDPKGSPFHWLRYFRFLPDHVLDNRYGRKLLKELGRRVFGLGSSFECCVPPKLLPWFNFVEKRNIYARGGIMGAPSIFDQLAAANIPYKAYSYHELPDEDILRQVCHDVEKCDVKFFFVYLSELDSFLHQHCTDAAAVKARLGWYAARLRELFARARAQDPDAYFCVFSDHGMTPIRHRVDLVTEVERLGLRAPKEYLAVYDSTMARFWMFNDQARGKMAKHLNSLTCGRLLSCVEQQQLGICFEDRRFGELIFLMNPGWLIAQSDFNGKRWDPKGMHGYDPDDQYSHAIFLANRRAPSDLSNIRDLYGVMRSAVDIGAKP